MKNDEHTQVRRRFRDFIVNRIGDAQKGLNEARLCTCQVSSLGMPPMVESDHRLQAGFPWLLPHCRYTSIGSGQLLFDLELIERSRNGFASFSVKEKTLKDQAARHPHCADLSGGHHLCRIASIGGRAKSNSTLSDSSELLSAEASSPTGSAPQHNSAVRSLAKLSEAQLPS